MGPELLEAPQVIQIYWESQEQLKLLADGHVPHLSTSSQSSWYPRFDRSAVTGVYFNKFTLVIVLRTEWKGVAKDRDKNPVWSQNYNPGR